MELPPDRVSTDVRVHDDNSTAVFLYSEPHHNVVSFIMLTLWLVLGCIPEKNSFAVHSRANKYRV
ncbi:hypothetical protein GY45DRAFT_1327149, partial [Cubamyces sp. BRFM 1775]